MSVEEYIRELEKLLIKCDIQEPKDQTIVRYLGGFDPKYANVVELQQYSTFDEVCVLVHEVKQQRKASPYEHKFAIPLPHSQPFNKGSSNPPLKTHDSNSFHPRRNSNSTKAPISTK